MSNITKPIILDETGARIAEALETIADGVVLKSTNDTTDRTAEIVAQLTSKGYCALGKGDFYAKNIVMPNNTMIHGIGKGTRLIMDSTQSGVLISVGNDCIIKDLFLDGLTTTVPGTIGDRTGIYLGEGKNLLKLSNLHIAHFNGSGIYVYKTGYNQIQSCQAANINIKKCFVGLYLAEKAEYGTYTNVLCEECNTGIRNDGGNNLFSSCGFNENTEYGFYLNGENITSPNNGHGSCVGCSFNHNGNGIYIRSNSNGFAFSGCEIFLNTTKDVDVWISGGVIFSGCNFGGGTKVRFAYGACNLISGCIFATTPTLEHINNNFDSKISSSFIANSGNEVNFPT